MGNSLRTRLLAGFAAVVALMCLLGALALSQMGTINNGAKTLHGTTIPRVELADQLQTLIAAWRKDQLRYAVSTSAEARKDAATDLDDDFKQIDELLTTYQKKL